MFKTISMPTGYLHTYLFTNRWILQKAITKSTKNWYQHTYKGIVIVIIFQLYEGLSLLVIVKMVNFYLSFE